jgi:hypothetical protein
MIWFHVIDAADVCVFSRHLFQPGTPGNIIAGLWVDPDVVDCRFFPEIDDVHPFQDIATATVLPAPNILFCCTCGKCTGDVQATMAALLAGEFLHTIHLLPFFMNPAPLFQLSARLRIWSVQ